MIGRADIEGSKSNVAKNAWLPQISYPCGKFSDTSQSNPRFLKGSIGLAFAIVSTFEAHDKTIFSPFSLRQISDLTETIIGHLWWILTDVPPQPNSRPMNVLASLHILKHMAVERVSSAASNVVVFHWRRSSHIRYSTCATVQKLARVNLNRVFLPFCQSLARSLSCRFAGKQTGTVGISLIRSCESLIR